MSAEKCRETLYGPVSRLLKTQAFFLDEAIIEEYGYDQIKQLEIWPPLDEDLVPRKVLRFKDGEVVVVRIYYDATSNRLWCSRSAKMPAPPPFSSWADLPAPALPERLEGLG